MMRGMRIIRTSRVWGKIRKGDEYTNALDGRMALNGMGRRKRGGQEGMQGVGLIMFL